MTMPTPTERIFDKLDEIGTDLAVVKSKLPTITDQALDHEKRLRSLEARLWYAVGAVGLIVVAQPIILRLLNV